MVSTEGSIEIVNFMTLGAGVLLIGSGYTSHIVTMLNFFTNRLYSKEQIKQNKYIVMKTK